MAYEMGSAEVRAVERVIRSKFLFRYGWPGSGWIRQVEKFERVFARFIGTRYAVATTNGTASLMTALASLGVGKGDEVIVPGFTFLATPLAVLAVGAVPVIADVDGGLGMDPDDVRKKISRRTRAIIPVHMTGLIANLGPLMKLARSRGLKVVEDCAQATGGSYRGRRVGSWGDAGAFSHNHYKTISAGEGGTVTLKERRLFARAMVYQDAGAYFFDPRMRRLAIPYFAGMNFRMSEVQAAMLLAQMKRLPRMLRSMNMAKRVLVKRLSGHPVCPPAPVHDLNGDCGKCIILRLEDSRLAISLADRLNRRGVDTASWFRSLSSDRHIYQNWWPILSKRGNIDPRQDPYLTTPAGRAVRYSRDMCPRTLDLLGRSVSVQIFPGWDRRKLDAVAGAIEEEAGKL